MAIGFLLALLLAEILLRVHVARRGWTPNCYVTGLAFFVPDPDTGQTLRPGLRMKSTSYDFSVNQLGLRGPEIDLIAAEDTLRIAVLGGSTTFGYLVPEGLDFCRLLETDLRGHGINAEVINAGVPGFTAAQCLARYQSLVSQLKPDIVMIYSGWNDTPYLLGKEHPGPSEVVPPSWLQRCLIRSVLYGFVRYRLFPPAAPHFAPPADLATDFATGIDESASRQFDDTLDQLLDAIKQSGATPIVSTQINAGSKTCDEAKYLLGADDEQIQINQKVSRWITSRVRAAAIRNQAKCIEIEECVPCNEQILGDPIHLTELGNRKVADCWRQHLLQFLDDSSKTESAGPLTESTGP